MGAVSAVRLRYIKIALSYSQGKLFKLKVTQFQKVFIQNVKNTNAKIKKVIKYQKAPTVKKCLESATDGYISSHCNKDSRLKPKRRGDVEIRRLFCKNC